jgi:hypothetical protein
MTHSSHDTALRDIHDLVGKEVLKKEEGRQKYELLLESVINSL